MNIVFSRESGFQLANTVVGNFFTSYGIQPLLANETIQNYAPPAVTSTFLPYIIITDIFV